MASPSQGLTSFSIVAIVNVSCDKLKGSCLFKGYVFKGCSQDEVISSDFSAPTRCGMESFVKRHAFVRLGQRRASSEAANARNGQLVRRNVCRSSRN